MTDCGKKKQQSNGKKGSERIRRDSKTGRRLRVRRFLGWTHSKDLLPIALAHARPPALHSLLLKQGDQVLWRLTQEVQAAFLCCLGWAKHVIQVQLQTSCGREAPNKRSAEQQHEKMELSLSALLNQLKPARPTGDPSS